jgi:hypothetical protein
MNFQFNRAVAKNLLVDRVRNQANLKSESIWRLQNDYKHKHLLKTGAVYNTD